MHWSQSFVGIPYIDLGRDHCGADCWGLVRMVYDEIARIRLPAFDGAYASADERAEVAAIIADQQASGPWSKVDAPLMLDIAVFRFDIQCHVGVVIEPTLMLHAVAGQQSAVQRYDRDPWARRLVGFYRHEGLA
jgi:cell wall-associated NlpC family hydrolase